MKRSEEQRLEYLVRRMQDDRSVDPPADAIRYAKNLFRTRAADRSPSVIERIAAVLKVDLAPDRAAFGERSAGSAARQMLFEMGDNAVDLRITPGDTGFDIRGQILGPGFERGDVEFQSEQHSGKSSVSEAEFKTLAIPSGEYSFTIRGVSTEIFIEKISLQ